MRKIGIALGIIAGLLILALAAVWLLANPNRHREAIQAQLEKQLGRKVTLGEMTLGFLPLRFQVENPVIAEDPSAGQTQPFVRAEKLDLKVKLLPLLRGNLQVESLELKRPSVELVKTAQGIWNFSTLGSQTASSAAAETPSNRSDSPGTQFSLDKLTILDGQIGITDLQKGQPRAGYDHIDLTLLNYAAGKPFSFDLAAHIQGTGVQEVRLQGDGGPVSTANPADTPFRGRLMLKEVGIDGLLKFIDMKTVTMAQGTLSGESEIANQLGAITTNGTLNLEQARFNGLDIGYPIKVEYKLAANIAQSQVTIDKATVLLGKTPLSVTGILNSAAPTLTMDLKVKSGDVSVEEIARLASAFGIAFAPGTSVTGRVSADVQATGSTAKPLLTGTIAGRDLQISGAEIPQPVQVKAVDLSLSPTTIRSNEFNATSGKTTVVGQFSLLQYASSSPSVDVGLRAPGATLPEIQSIAKAYGLTGLDQITGAGTLNFDLRAKGSLQSLTAASATKALNGVINLDFSPLKIAGFDTVHALGKLGGFASNLTEQNSTDILKMVGRIVVKNGVAQTDDLRAQTSAGNLSATGSADLSAETLNMKLAAVFSKAFSDKVGSTRAGGLLNTAFSNSAGEIVLPAMMTGSFRQPKFAPDLKAVAQLQKQRFIPSLDNPAGAVSNVLGVLTGKTKPTEDQPEGKKPSVMKGILDALGGGKK